MTRVDPEVAYGDAEWGDGYGFFPCLLTELDNNILSIVPLRADLHPDILIEVGAAQAEANDLPTRLCSGTAGLNFRTERAGHYHEREMRLWPRSDIVIASALRLPTFDVLGSREQDAELQRFISENALNRTYVSDSYVPLTNRWAEYREEKRAGYDNDGVPVGCRRCGQCGEYHGSIVQKHRPAMGNLNGNSTAAHIYCRCANNNRCAFCGRPLAERKLRARYFDETTRRVTYMSGLHALAHPCDQIEIAIQTICRGGTKKEA